MVVMRKFKLLFLGGWRTWVSFSAGVVLEQGEGRRISVQELLGRALPWSRPFHPGGILVIKAVFQHRS